MTDLCLLTSFVQTKDPEVFKVLVVRYQGLVSAACRRHLYNDADVEDAAQKVFIALMENAHRVDTNVGGWLHRCARNTAISMVRSDAARKQRELTRATDDCFDDRNVHWNEMREVIDESLNQLRPDDMEAIIQSVFLKRSQAVIAEQVGVSQQAIAKRVSKALVKLRNILRSKGVAVSALTLASVLEEHAVAATVPSKLTALLTHTATKWAASTAAITATGGVGVVTKLKASAVIAAMTLIVSIPHDELPPISRANDSMDSVALDTSQIETPEPRPFTTIRAKPIVHRGWTSASLTSRQSRPMSVPNIQTQGSDSRMVSPQLKSTHPKQINRVNAPRPNAKVHLPSPTRLPNSQTHRLSYGSDFTIAEAKPVVERAREVETATTQDGRKKRAGFDARHDIPLKPEYAKEKPWPPPEDGDVRDALLSSIGLVTPAEADDVREGIVYSFAAVALSTHEIAYLAAPAGRSPPFSTNVLGDNTLAPPSEVFAGWATASEFYGLPASNFGAGSRHQQLTAPDHGRAPPPFAFVIGDDGRLPPPHMNDLGASPAVLEQPIDALLLDALLLEAMADEIVIEPFFAMTSSASIPPGQTDPNLIVELTADFPGRQPIAKNPNRDDPNRRPSNDSIDQSLPSDSTAGSLADYFELDEHPPATEPSRRTNPSFRNHDLDFLAENTERDDQFRDSLMLAEGMDPSHSFDPDSEYIAGLFKFDGRPQVAGPLFRDTTTPREHDSPMPAKTTKINILRPSDFPEDFEIDPMSIDSHSSALFAAAPSPYGYLSSAMPIPEPTSFFLLATGAIVLARRRPQLR